MAKNRIQVLLIEDNPVHVKMLEQLLAESAAPGFDVHTAGRLSDGLDQIGTNGNVDVVLLDLVLPDSEDLETFARVHAKAPNLPVVILTSLDDVNLAARAVELGAQDYLLKTRLDQAALGRSISYALERKRARSGEFDEPKLRQERQQYLQDDRRTYLIDSI